MALYGNNEFKELKEVSSYIRNDFLNFCLNEEAKNLREDITKYKDTGIGQEEILKKLAVLTDEKRKDLDNLTKDKLIEAYLDAFRYRNIYMESIDSDETAEQLLEFSGDEYKNKQFKQTLQEVDKYLIAFIKELQDIDKLLIKITSLYSKCKNVNTARKAYTDAIKEAEAVNKALKKMFADIDNGISPFKKFDKQAGTFNNKYSTVTMEEKKIFDKKIKEYIKQVNDIIEPWGGGEKNGVKVQALIDAMNNFRDCMPELSDKADAIPQGWYKYMFEAYRDDIGVCYWIRKKLGIEVEGSIKWKIVHALFKK